MDDQPVTEGRAGLLAESRILDAVPTAVVAQGSHSRWIGSGDWSHFAGGERW